MLIYLVCIRNSLIYKIYILCCHTMQLTCSNRVIKMIAYMFVIYGLSVLPLKLVGRNLSFPICWWLVKFVVLEALQWGHLWTGFLLKCKNYTSLTSFRGTNYQPQHASFYYVVQDCERCWWLYSHRKAL